MPATPLTSVVTKRKGDGLTSPDLFAIGNEMLRRFQYTEDQRRADDPTRGVATTIKGDPADQW